MRSGGERGGGGRGGGGRGEEWRREGGGAGMKIDYMSGLKQEWEYMYVEKWRKEGK